MTSKPLSVSGSIPVRKSTKLVLATPAYGGTFYSEYVSSMYAVMTLGQSKGIAFAFSQVDYADIVTSRNYLLSNFYYNKPDAEAILFVDSDMGYPAELIFEMVALGEPVVGVIAPRRSIDLRALHAAGNVPFEQAYAKALDFIGAPKSPHPRNPGFMSVDSIGAGILLIRRSAIDLMVARLPELVDTQRFKHYPFASKFQRFLTPFDKLSLDDRWLSEDLSFCHRWSALCEQPIYAATHHPITHVARVALEGQWSKRE